LFGRCLKIGRYSGKVGFLRVWFREVSLHILPHIIALNLQAIVIQSMHSLAFVVNPLILYCIRHYIQSHYARFALHSLQQLLPRYEMDRWIIVVQLT
jgi:hypothetical protein